MGDKYNMGYYNSALMRHYVDELSEDEKEEARRYFQKVEKKLGRDGRTILNLGR